jgi:8-oxo-dGTP pyrophosphatase MutT (NUDIX family)
MPVQVAALCYRETADGVRVLMVTSRGSGRWILPKGWPIRGKDGSQSAQQEAWEEAGVRQADLESEPLGRYVYTKRLDNGTTAQVETYVYRMEVEDLASDYPECDSRDRRWICPQEAANLVSEPELRELLLSL